MIKNLIVFSTCLTLVLGTGSAQSIINTPVTGTYEDITAVELIQVIENNYKVKIYYEPSRTPYFKVSLTFQNTPLLLAIRKIVAGTVLSVQYYEDKIVLLPKLEATKEKVISIINGWESGEYQKPIDAKPESISYQFGQPSAFDGNTSFVLSGRITDRFSKVAVIGALIQDVSTGLGAITDVNGQFEYRSKAGELTLLVSYLGYRSIELKIGLYENAKVDLSMSVASVDLNEVVIEAKANQNKLEDPNVGLEFLSANEIKALPSFLGEADVIRGIEQLPGVSTVSEAATGFNVRGGNIDQNLVLLDEALIFNTSHALGFFSIFHPDAVSTVSLYKGHIPAKYGGRLSSVLAVDLKDPHRHSWHGAGGLGVASARLKIEGPLTANKTSILLGLRSTYSDWILRQADNDDVRNSNLYFGDGLIKLVHELNPGNQLALSAYISHDDFKFSDEFGFAWRSSFVNFRWRYLFQDSLILSTHLISGVYQSKQFEPEGAAAFNLTNGIDYVKFKSQLSLNAGKHLALMGVEGIRYHMRPERITPFDKNSVIRQESISKNQGIQTALYIEDNWRITPGLSLSAGLRYALFMTVGPDKVFQYTPQLPKSEPNISDSLFFNSGEIVKTYGGLEPRISFNIRLHPTMALKTTYNLQRQYIHLISNTAASIPIDSWQLSNTYIKPASAHNFSIGVYKDFNKKWLVSIETFYKALKDVVQYKDFAELVLNPILETQLLQSQGRTYGVELLLRKQSGAMTGQLAYTFSRSQIRARSPFLEEQINQGHWFANSFDQPHQLNVTFKYEFNPINSFQISFNYKSGRPITAPVAAYGLATVLVTEFSERNAFRIPDYHRLDFSFNIDHSETKVRGLRNSFSISFYNLYSRQNAFTVFFRQDSKNILRAYQLAILGKLFPSITWNINF